jgi:hypothetical protein
LTMQADCNKLLHDVTAKEGMLMYVTRLINFGRLLYQGHSLDAAMEAAISSGVECTVDGYGMTMSWSPVHGWRTAVEMA